MLRFTYRQHAEQFAAACDWLIDLGVSIDSTRASEYRARCWLLSPSITKPGRLMFLSRGMDTRDCSMRWLKRRSLFTSTPGSLDAPTQKCSVACVSLSAEQSCWSTKVRNEIRTARGTSDSNYQSQRQLRVRP